MLQDQSDRHDAAVAVNFPARAFHHRLYAWASVQLVAISIAAGAALASGSHAVADASGWPRWAVLGVLLAILSTFALSSFARSVRGICVSSRGLEITSLSGTRQVGWPEVINVARSSSWRTALGPGPTTMTSSSRDHVRIATRRGSLYFAPESVEDFLRAVQQLRDLRECESGRVPDLRRCECAGKHFHNNLGASNSQPVSETCIWRRSAD